MPPSAPRSSLRRLWISALVPHPSLFTSSLFIRKVAARSNRVLMAQILLVFTSMLKAVMSVLAVAVRDM
jgi:hypothetical protein